ncbi:MAG TPA: hypothetical protein VH080_10095 [Gemmatimonadaceae bacterium]|nr:hypothetical protein [Gemmatimonadaceae bacterium]
MVARPIGAAATLSVVALALVSACASVAAAQATGTKRTPAPTAAQSQAQPLVNDRLRRQIEQMRARPEGSRLPPPDSFTVGPRAITSTTPVNGRVALANGSLDVSGRLDGSAYVINGDIVVHDGGVITGDAVSIGGHVLLDGGRIDGERVALSAPATEPVRAPESAPLTTWQSVKLVLGWFAVLVIIGLGVLIFAEPNMDGVVEAMEGSFARAFWMGVLGEIMALPVLALLVVGLILTLLGILLVPFAVVAYVIALAGLLALGFLAVARLTGSFWSRADAAGTSTPRSVNLRALFMGLVLYMGLWLLAAIFTWQPIAGAVLRGIALAVSWVAVTVGLGATLLSRAGTRRLSARSIGATGRRPAPADLAWQTPTPVTGVTAARRPATVVKDAS